LNRISLSEIESLARISSGYTDADQFEQEDVHPFSRRNISGELPGKVRGLFDNGHYEEAALCSFVYFDKFIQKKSGIQKIGKKLMLQSFGGKTPPIKIADLNTDTGESEQEGMMFMSAGGVRYIRNPRAHETSMGDSPDNCLDYLSFVSMMIREINLRTK
jgi:uncharacterized protein (TIGR02391 family)